MKRPASTILFAVSLFLSIGARAQADSTQLQKIDSLFAAWNAPNHPGGATGVFYQQLCALFSENQSNPYLY